MSKIANPTKVITGVRRSGKSKLLEQFNNFGDEIDPDNEHDFGFVSVDDIDIMFQIDCLQANSNQICSNPNTAEQSRRVLSIMLTKEC